MADPLRVAVVGALGRMGEHVCVLLAGEPGLTLAAAVEAPGHPRLGEDLGAGVCVADDPKPALAGCDVAVVFATPAGALTSLLAAAEARVACVVGTTGFAPEQRAEVERAAERVPVVLAPNFSVAVNVLGHLVRRAAALLGPDFDAELLELHHSGKRDAPSGTALWLAEAVAAGQGRPAGERLVVNRAGQSGPRPPGAIGIQALRGGDSPGEHSVLFLGRGERLELLHRAATRDHFARGALRAARWVVGRAPGLYAMADVLGLED